MTWVWFAASFNDYLIMFLLTSFDQVYVSVFASSMSDIIGYLIAGFILKFLGLKKTLFCGFGSATIGGLIILFFGLRN